VSADTPPVRILSGIQPWWFVVIHLGKNIENRRTPLLGRHESRYRGEVLLHASKSKGTTTDWKHWEEAHDFVMDRFGAALADRIPPIGQLPMGGIVGRATVIGLVRPWFPTWKSGSASQPSVLDEEAQARALAAYPAGVDPRWHMREQNGYLLSGARSTPFVPWRGGQSAVLAPQALLTAVEQEDLLS
jgi:hypothetical protein